jgi:hypothetical protein
MQKPNKLFYNIIVIASNLIGAYFLYEMFLWVGR